MLKIQRFASRSHSARVLGLKLTPIFIIFQYKRIQKASREEKSTLTKWISLQRSFSENRQSLLFPLEEGFKVKAFNVFHLSDTPVLACVSIFAHTHAHTHWTAHECFWSLMLDFGLVSHWSRVSLSYNKLCVHYWCAFWRSEKLAATLFVSE